jgi:hypothetical protein
MPKPRQKTRPKAKEPFSFIPPAARAIRAISTPFSAALKRFQAKWKPVRVKKHEKSKTWSVHRLYPVAKSSWPTGSKRKSREFEASIRRASDGSMGRVTLSPLLFRHPRQRC